MNILIIEDQSLNAHAVLVWALAWVLDVVVVLQPVAGVLVDAYQVVFQLDVPVLEDGSLLEDDSLVDNTLDHTMGRNNLSHNTQIHWHDLRHHGLNS